MVVADYHIEAQRSGIIDLFVGLDAAVQSDDEAEPVFLRPVYSPVGQAVAILIAVRNVEIDIRGISPQE